MVAEQDWIEAYKELCVLIKDPNNQMPEIEHVDLWYQQIDNLEEEYPFPPQCVFLEFAMDNIETTGMNVQDINAEIAVYFAFDTLSDSWDGSDNQAIALQFGNTCRKLHKLLQGRAGNHFSGLNRIALRRYATNTPGMIVYVQVYRGIIRDYAAFKETQNVTIGNVQLDSSTPPPPAVDVKMFDINL